MSISASILKPRLPSTIATSPLALSEFHHTKHSPNLYHESSVPDLHFNSYGCISHHSQHLHVCKLSNSAYSLKNSSQNFLFSSLFSNPFYKRHNSCMPLAFFNRKNEPENDEISEGVVSGLELERGKNINHKSISYNAVFWLLVINLTVFILDHVLKIPIMKNLYLYHSRTQWYQFLTSTFCHANWNHLSGNLFFVYIFGKLVEEEEGELGVWTTYLVTGIGANIVSWLLLPSYFVSVGASGAVFGLFAVSVLVKLNWNWRNILEVLILGQFVIEKILSEAQAQAVSGVCRSVYSTNINHIAHLSGALLGVALIWMLTKIEK